AAAPCAEVRTVDEAVRELGVLDEQLLACAPCLEGAAQVLGRIDVVVLVADRGGIEDQPQAVLHDAVAEVDVLAAEEPVAREARVEPADALVRPAGDRHLTAQEVVEPDLSSRSREPLTPHTGPEADAPAEEISRRVGMQ